jgi:hypothetical protein
MVSVEIAVPTYNAGAYLDDFFQSILEQDFKQLIQKGLWH